MSTTTTRNHVPLPGIGIRTKSGSRLRGLPATIPYPVSDEILVESLAFHHGLVYDSYLACESDRERFWSADRSGVLTYVNVAGHLKVGGGLLARPEDKPKLLDEFLQFVRKKYHSAVFFNITDADLPLFQRRAIQVTKWGEDPLIDLATWNCQGKPFEWLRRQKNYCSRHQVRCSEWSPALCSNEERILVQEEIRLVARESLQDKPQSGEMKFFEGRLDFDCLGKKRIFLARSENGLRRIEAFLVVNPYQSGTGWGFEMYRHRQDSVRGAVAHLMLSAVEMLKREGALQISLCLIPALNCDSSQSGDSTLLRKLLSVGARYLNAIFDTAGMYHFKSRFRPRMESRYVCAFPRANLSTVVTTAHLMGIFQLSLPKLACRLWRQVTRPANESLAAYHDATPTGQERHLGVECHH